jgi:glycosyltransferase involved in cell wall biosynthesis
MTLVSVVVNNYNYGRFLRDAIDSALAQTYAPLEVVVVDDGSTDDSREIIAAYGDRVISLLKENGGQTSAFNAAFAACRGDVIVFLDADDVLLPNTVADAVRRFEPGVTKVHWALSVVDAAGCPVGRLKPALPLLEGDLRDVVLRDGPENATWPPTSGNAWSRAFLERVFPLPEPERAHDVGSASADAHLAMLAPLYGEVRRLDVPGALYRLHGKNDHSAMPFRERLRRDVALFDVRCEALEAHCGALGLTVDPDAWRAGSWFHRLHRSIDELRQVIRADEDFVLIDDGSWDMAGERELRPIPLFAGEDEDTIGEIERLRARGTRHVVVAWPAFWWLSHYERLGRYLRDGFRPVVRNDRLVVYRHA